MNFVADLHLHSKYSRAVSQQMVLTEMAKWASKKGINLLTTGDWTHPLWLRAIKSELEEAGKNLIYHTRGKRELYVAVGRSKLRLIFLVLNRKGAGKYYLVTARDAGKKERKVVYEKEKK